MVMRYHTVTTTAGDGQLLSCSLPDGSKVELNAGSTLAYHPYWWSFSRNLEFEGEGYFEVEKGKRFRVGSAKGTTEVLGTSFTIYARADEYRVACLTGKVRVESAAGEKTVLIPGHSANIESDGSITIGIIENSKAAASWIKGMFSFNARPLRLVLEEIQRQYGIAVSFEDNGEYRFTGYFAKEKPVEEVLELVCKPFGLNFVKHSDTAFEILKN
jgi:ferric-dicitrate binding protein FerR (iron transport regulator)